MPKMKKNLTCQISAKVRQTTGPETSYVVTQATGYVQGNCVLSFIFGIFVCLFVKKSNLKTHLVWGQFKTINSSVISDQQCRFSHRTNGNKTSITYRLTLVKPNCVTSDATRHCRKNDSQNYYYKLKGNRQAWHDRLNSWIPSFNSFSDGDPL